MSLDSCFGIVTSRDILKVKQHFGQMIAMTLGKNKINGFKTKVTWTWQEPSSKRQTWQQEPEKMILWAQLSKPQSPIPGLDSWTLEVGNRRNSCGYLSVIVLVIWSERCCQGSGLLPGSGLTFARKCFFAREMDFCQEEDLVCQEIDFLRGKWTFARKWTWFCQEMNFLPGKWTLARNWTWFAIKKKDFCQEAGSGLGLPEKKRNSF